MIEIQVRDGQVRAQVKEIERASKTLIGSEE